MLRKPIVLLALIVAVSITVVLIASYNPNPGGISRSAGRSDSRGGSQGRPASDFTGSPLHSGIAGKPVRGEEPGPDEEPIDAAGEGSSLAAVGSPEFAEALQGPWPIGCLQPAGRADFSLLPGGIARIAVCTKGGRPVPGAAILLSDRMEAGARWQATTDFSGIALFIGLNASSLTAMAVADGYAPGGVTFDIAPESMSSEEIVLVPAGSLRVVVREEDGRSLPGAAVSLSRFTLFGLDPVRLADLGLIQVSGSSFQTDGSGVFTLGGLPSCRIGLKVAKAGLTHSTEVKIAAGRENVVQVTLR